MPAAPAPPATVPPRRRPPWWAAAAGLAAVLWLHGVLIGALAPARPLRAGDGARPAPALQVRALAMLPPAATAPAAVDAPVPAPPSARAPSPRPLAGVLAAGPLPAAAAAVPPDPARPEGALADAEPAPGAAGGIPAAPAAEPGADAGEPPPVYPTRLPPPVRLRYQLRYNGQAGEAVLAWHHDGTRYQLQLDGRGAAQALVEQASQGGFDAAGLAPERFVDRRRGRGWQAANFRRDAGRIGFSGPQTEHPAWPGAQDRLSWLAQFAAIQAAAGGPPAAVRLFVVDARGAGALWQFEPQGEVLLDTALGPRPAQHWRREPPRPEGLRVDTWLDARADAPHGGWPLQLRFTALRSGDVFELHLAPGPPPP